MMKAANSMINKPAATRAKSARKSLKANNELLLQVEKEKKLRNEKKKKRAQEKREEEEQAKATADQEKTGDTYIISPVTTKIATDLPDPNINKHIGNITIDLATEKPDSTIEGTAESLQCRTEEDATDDADELMGCQLFTDRITTTNSAITMTTTSQEDAIDLSGKSPKKKTKGPAGALHAENRYTATTTAKFTLPSTTLSYSYLCMYAEAAISLSLEDKPKELIAAIKLLLRNGRYLDPHFGLTPLKAVNGMKPKIILKEEDVPLNFTHLGLYMGTSGRQIFEPKKKWKDNNKGQPHRDDKEEEIEKSKEAVVYFTFAFATTLDPHTLIDGIRNKWETHGGGKLMVKDPQSCKSKVAFILYFVYTGTPHKYILQTLQSILQEAADMLEGDMTKEYGDEHQAVLTPKISIRAQVPRLKGVEAKDFNKLPWHVREYRK
jgi:hypothetical protein